MIKIVKGDMFEDDFDVLVNPVNCVGVMGKGLARLFKNKFPEMFEKYKQDCKMHYYEPGTVSMHFEKGTQQVILNAATKDHWKDPSSYEWIEKAMNQLAQHLVLIRVFQDNLFTEAPAIIRVAIPALGCGNGGLDFDRVRPMMLAYLEDYAYSKNVEISIFSS